MISEFAVKFCLVPQENRKALPTSSSLVLASRFSLLSESPVAAGRPRAVLHMTEQRKLVTPLNENCTWWERPTFARTSWVTADVNDRGGGVGGCLLAVVPAKPLVLQLCVYEVCNRRLFEALD